MSATRVRVERILTREKGRGRERGRHHINLSRLRRKINILWHESCWKVTVVVITVGLTFFMLWYVRYLQETTGGPLNLMLDREYRRAGITPTRDHREAAALNRKIELYREYRKIEHGPKVNRE